MNIIGIDPGTSGAIALLNGSRMNVRDIPVIVTKKATGKRDKMGRPTYKTRTEYDAAGCAGVIEAWADREDETAIYLEAVNAHPIRGGGDKGRCQACGKPLGPQDSLVSAHKMGVGIGLWLGIAATLRIPVHMVQPLTWKRRHGLIKTDKEASRHKAIQLFPALSESLKLKKHHNRAEALLIAAHGRMSA